MLHAFRIERPRATSAFGARLICAVALTAVSCEGRQPPSTTARSFLADAPTKAVADSRETESERFGTERPSPELVLCVNGGQTAHAYQGRPLILEAALFHPHDGDADASRQLLPPAAGGGLDAAIVRIEVRNERGELQTWPLHRYDVAPATTSPSAGDPIDMAWWLTPEETAQLASGTYQLRAVLDTTGSDEADAWKGRVTGGAVTVRVVPEPASLSSAQKSERLQLLASYELLRGDAKRALAHIDELLRAAPDDVGGWEYRGDLLARDGNPEAALDAYDRAARAFQKTYRRPPPETLLRKRREQLNKLITSPPTAANKAVGPLEVGFLSADVPEGKVLESPFPASALRLSFVWKRSDAARAAPLEVRWIAAAGERRIAQARAEPGAGSGEFLLPNPGDGFAEGDYRLELRQDDRLLHREQFAIVASPTVAPAGTSTSTASATHRDEKRSIDGWGAFVDPAGDCRIVRDDAGIVTITVPGTPHDLNPEPAYDDVSAPRVLQPVEGDFRLEVKVSAFPRPGAGTSTTKQAHAYVAAGIVVWQDDKTFIRWLRAASGERGDLFVHAEAFRDGKRQELRFLAKDRLIPDEATYLRIERRYRRFKLSWSRDGLTWTSFAQLPDDGLAAKLQVGIAALNATNVEFAPRFELLQRAGEEKP